MSADDSLSATEHRVRDIAERYVDELDSKLSTRDLEAVLHGEKDDLASRDLGSKPETHVQNNFVYPLLDAMGLACTGGGGYWLNAVPESIHGEDATTIDELYFDDELTQKTVFLIVNSSTSYVYWVIYGFFYVLNTGHITRSPVPEEEVLEENASEIDRLADELWSGMQAVHSGGSRDQFDMPALKPVIDRVNELFGELYGFDEDVVEYLKEYNAEYGRKGSDSGSLDSYAKAEVTDD